MAEKNYTVINVEGGSPIKAWVKGVPIEDAAARQLQNVAKLPFIYKWVAAMPDVHWGIGATVGSVIPTRGAIIPAAVNASAFARAWVSSMSPISTCIPCFASWSAMAAPIPLTKQAQGHRQLIW